MDLNNIPEVSVAHINVLGVEYTIYMGPCEFLRLPSELAGDCDPYLKVIRLRTDFDHENSQAKFDTMLMTFLRHELAHAFLFESGLTQYAFDEALACWCEVGMTKMTQCVEMTYNVLHNLAPPLS